VPELWADNRARETVPALHVHRHAEVEEAEQKEITEQMKLTAGHGFALEAALNKLVQIENLPFKAAYRVMRLAEKLESEMRTAKKARGELFRDLGEPVLDADGKETGQAAITPENMTEFQEKYAVIAADEITMPDWKVRLPDEITGLSPATLFTLMPFLDVEDDELTEDDDDAETVEAGVPAPGA